MSNVSVRRMPAFLREETRTSSSILLYSMAVRAYGLLPKLGQTAQTGTSYDLTAFAVAFAPSSNSVVLAGLAHFHPMERRMKQFMQVRIRSKPWAQQAQ